MSKDVEVKVKEVVKNGGYSLKPSGAVDLTLLANYGELINSVKVLQMLNNDVTIKARIPGKKPFMLGVFRVKSVVFDDDGESKLKFNGLSDFIEMPNLNMLPIKTDESQEFVVLMEANVELEDEDVDDE